MLSSDRFDLDANPPLVLPGRCDCNDVDRSLDLANEFSGFWQSGISQNDMMILGHLEDFTLQVWDQRPD